MPLYEFACAKCGEIVELLMPMDHEVPLHCGEVMNRKYTVESMKVKWGPEPWMRRMDEIHKAQADRGERLRFVHPSEIRAS